MDYTSADIAIPGLGSTRSSGITFVEDEGPIAVMMPFRRTIQKNLKKIEDLDFDLIAPSHGPIYDKPECILDAY